ncbi:molybdate ABC transporter substrate-binding protein [Thiovibrio frasassiensis]|uniref:Molybdate ABC transporter substrate-binding protein n=1 Tax=Thiovibrio frasassiensis TaxID=2984131 RepID=A0A9X4RQ50_9BACT|nr:molybdate ABC transporter substrate-binding protein [Thiovibrio frasassiensis]MDG4475897.1 molybdate ABC transporter substrate-binding protein [Thiovibrio frasassiensis]
MVLRTLIALSVVLSSLSWVPTPARAETELLVSAAASLTESFKELTRVYGLKTPGVKVRCNFAGSGTLLQQISQGAPADLFVSADQETMDRAEKSGLLVPGSRLNFVGNSLVLITPAQMVQVTDLADLKSVKVQRIGMGNPNSVPAGRYAKAALEKQGLWQDLAPKCVMGISVKQALEYVMRGEVEAGFVFASDAVAAKERVRVAAEIPTVSPIVYPVAVVAGSSQQAEAQAFVRFLQGKEAQTILAQYGFKKP